MSKGTISEPEGIMAVDPDVRYGSIYAILTMTVIALGILMAYYCCSYRRVILKSFRNFYEHIDVTRKTQSDMWEKIEIMETHPPYKTDLPPTNLFEDFDYVAFRAWQNNGAFAYGAVIPDPRSAYYLTPGTQGKLYRDCLDGLSCTERERRNREMDHFFGSKEYQRKILKEPSAIITAMPKVLSITATGEKLACRLISYCGTEEDRKLLRDFEVRKISTIQNKLTEFMKVEHKGGRVGLTPGFGCYAIVAYIDCGSDINLLSKRMAKKANIPIYKLPPDILAALKVSQAEGNPMHFIGCAVAGIVLNTRSYEQMFFVPANSGMAEQSDVDVLLGNPFLARVGRLALDFQKEMIHLKCKETGMVHSFHMDTSKGKPIIMIGDHNIAPRTRWTTGNEGIFQPIREPHREPQFQGHSDLAKNHPETGASRSRRKGRNHVWGRSRHHPTAQETDLHKGNVHG
jgi:hypothetical protein